MSDVFDVGQGLGYMVVSHPELRESPQKVLNGLHRSWTTSALCKRFAVAEPGRIITLLNAAVEYLINWRGLVYVSVDKKDQDEIRSMHMKLLRVAAGLPDHIAEKDQGGFDGRRSGA